MKTRFHLTLLPWALIVGGAPMVFCDLLIARGVPTESGKLTHPTVEHDSISKNFR